MSHDWSLLVRWRGYAGGNQKWSRFKNVYSAIGKLMDDGDAHMGGCMGGCMGAA